MLVTQVISDGLNDLLRSENIKTRLKGVELAGALARATEAEEFLPHVITGMNMAQTQLQDATFTSAIEGLEHLLNFLPNAAVVRQNDCCHRELHSR